MLIPIKVGEPSDRLYWRVFEQNVGWGEQQMFIGQRSSENPALALQNGTTYCVFKSGHNNDLNWIACDPDGNGWNRGDMFHGGVQTRSSPALTVWLSHLFCMHRGLDDRLYYATRDWPEGSQWGPWQAMPGHKTSTGPALAVMNDVVYCAFKAGHNNEQYMVSTHDGNSWVNEPGGAQSRQGPALLAGRDKNGSRPQLMCAYRGA